MPALHVDRRHGRLHSGGGHGQHAVLDPGDPSLAGTSVLGQSAVFVPGINRFGFVTSNGLRMVLDLL
ncbi:MAG TPA: hypothetical protein VF384_07175 [Planctomycetota bacterium]